MTRSSGLIETTPPTWSFTGARPRIAHTARRRCCRGSRVRAVTLKELPVVTIPAFVVRHTFGHVLVFGNHVVDDVVDFMVSYAHAPAVISNCVIDAL